MDKLIICEQDFPRVIRAEEYKENHVLFQLDKKQVAIFKGAIIAVNLNFAEISDLLNKLSDITVAGKDGYLADSNSFALFRDRKDWTQTTVIFLKGDK